MALVSSFADASTVRKMAGGPDPDEVSDDQITIYCNTADAKFKNDTNIASLDSADPRYNLAISAANKQAAILVRLQWGDRELRLPILRDLYDSDIKSINSTGLIPGHAPSLGVAKSSYRTRKLMYGELESSYYLSMY